MRRNARSLIAVVAFALVWSALVFHIGHRIAARSGTRTIGRTDTGEVVESYTPGDVPVALLTVIAVIPSLGAFGLWYGRRGRPTA